MWLLGNMTDGVCVTVRVGGAVLKGRGERHLRGGGAVDGRTGQLRRKDPGSAHLQPTYTPGGKPAEVL